MEEKMDRYGNQFATRVEHNTEYGVIFADVVQESGGGGWYRLVVGGIVLSPLYANKEDAQDAADVILGRLVAGELLVEPMPEDDYPGEVLPTGWDAVDHKAMYE
jgi:hypothetical protein